jgi:hypothetical protein
MIINGEPVSGSISERKWYCRIVGSLDRAQLMLMEGLTYLDGNGDGEACEALR